MSRSLAAALALGLVACHGGPPEPPTAAAWAAMSPDQRCAATEPRTNRCADEIILLTLDQLAKGSDLDLKGTHEAIEKDAHMGPNHVDEDEGAAIHRATCAGDSTYADAVYACWAADGCRGLTKCILARAPTPSAAPP